MTAIKNPRYFDETKERFLKSMAEIIGSQAVFQVVIPKLSEKHAKEALEAIKEDLKSLQELREDLDKTGSLPDDWAALMGRSEKEYEMSVAMLEATMLNNKNMIN